MSSERVLVLLAILSLTAPRAWAQEQRLDGKLDPATARAVGSVLARARANGLPTEPLIDKVLEGIAKKRPGARITPAVELLASRLEAARDALLPGPSSPELRAMEIVEGANAIGVGIETVYLRRLRAVRPHESIAFPIAVLTQLVSTNRAPAANATETVIKLMRSGAEPAHLIALSDSVGRDVGNGMRPDASLDLRGRGIIGAMRPPAGVATDATTPGGTTLSAPKRP